MPGQSSSEKNIGTIESACYNCGVLKSNEQEGESSVDIRATCLNCMDGRVQLPVLHWIKEQHKVDFVDVITEAGIDAVLANQDDIHEILRSIDISVNINRSTRLFVVGHFDCRGNPVDQKTHHIQIASAVKRLKERWHRHGVSGLWVNHHWQVEIVA